MLTIIGLINSLANHSADDMGVSELIWFSVDNTLFKAAITILVLGFVIIWKRDSEEWGAVFYGLGIAILVPALIATVFLVSFGIIVGVIVLVIPILMISGGAMNRKEAAKPQSGEQETLEE